MLLMDTVEPTRAHMLCTKADSPQNSNATRCFAFPYFQPLRAGLGDGRVLLIFRKSDVPGDNELGEELIV